MLDETIYDTWCAFFVARPHMLRYVYVDSYVNQSEISLAIRRSAQDEFVEWIRETSRQYSFSDIVSIYFPSQPEFPWRHWVTTFNHAASVPLPFTFLTAPQSLKKLYEIKRGWVYILSMAECSLLKIGYCLTTPAKRLATLQSGTPYRLTLLASYAHKPDEAPLIERAMHQLLKDTRQGRREWFAVDFATAQRAHDDAIIKAADDLELEKVG